MTEWFLTADLGGTKIAAARIATDGRIAARRTIPTRAEEGMAAVTDRLARLLVDLSGPESERPLACGIGTPGIVDAAAGVIRYAVNLPGAQDYPLAQRLQAALQIPVAVDNDLRLHALGESAFGAAVGCQNFIFVSVGTGVGMALMLNGELVRGGQFAAGELGHILIDRSPDAPRCACGRLGCLEAVASGPAMTDRFRRLAAEDGLGQDACTADLAKIAAWSPADDRRGELARSVIGAGARALGEGLSIAVNLFDPQRIVLGGGVARLGKVWLDGVYAALSAHALRPFLATDIQPPRLGDDSPLAGALVLARQASTARP